MNRTLLNTCELFMANTEILRDNFRLEGDEMNRLGSSLLTAEDVRADVSRLRECEGILRKNSGIFSTFRGHLKTAIVCSMSKSEDPTEYFRNVERAYRLLRINRQMENEMFALAAVSIADRAEEEEALLFLVDRTVEIYERLRVDRRFGAESGSFVTAAIAASSDIHSVDEYLQNVCLCREILNESVPESSINTLCLALALDRSDTKLKCGRLREIYDRLSNEGICYGKGHEITVLAGLTMLDLTNEEIVSAVSDADSFLRDQKGFGIFGCSADIRHMYSALMVMYAFMPERTSGKRPASHITDDTVISDYKTMNTHIFISVNISLMLQNELIMMNKFN